MPGDGRLEVAGMLDGTAFVHSAMVVRDLDRSMAELTGTLGVRWASHTPPRAPTGP